MMFAYELTTLAPPPQLTISSWADEKRQLSPEASAEPGRWQTSRAEYQRGIMDAVKDPAIETVVIMSSSQVGKTEIINNICGYFIDQDPSPILVLQPTLEMAQTWSKDRFSTMVRDTPALRDKIKNPRTRDSGNTILHKIFPGGHITASGANSPASLASRPIRIVLCDEVDRYPPSAGTEGDPVSLAVKRSTTFWNRKIVLVSTPTTKDLSRIEAAYNESDRRRFYVPCPKCGEYQFLEWAHVVWEKDHPETARYLCRKCGEKWTDAQRWGAVRNGEWRAEAEYNGVAGFHIWEAYSSWIRLEHTVRSHLSAMGHYERRKTWVNTVLGETFEEQGDQPEAHILYRRREEYPAEVPAGGLVLTCAVDVQDDRLEVDVKAYGPGNESWAIEKTVIYGDLVKEGPWKQLDDYLQTEFDHEWGIKLRISCTVIDSGGHYTDQVYKFCKGKQGRRIFAIKGANTPGAPLISKPNRSNKARIPLFSVGTDTAKEILYARLKIDEPGNGYMHFPMEYPEEYFDQLTAEKAVTKYKRGFPYRVWIKTRPRNEALDLTVYSMAALDILNPNMERIKRFLENQRPADMPEKIIEEKDNPILKQRQQFRRPKKQGWMSGINNRR